MGLRWNLGVDHKKHSKSIFNLFKDTVFMYLNLHQPRTVQSEGSEG